MSSDKFTPLKRVVRTSNPTPPEREGKKSRIDMLDQSTDKIDPFVSETIQTMLPQQFTISDADVKKIADAVKANIITDINNIIKSHTEPLIEQIDNLKVENRKLREDLDAVEQYGRRSLIRISGIPEPEGESDTTDAVNKIIKEIDPEYKEGDIVRSHRVGRPQLENDDEPRCRQIIVRLSEPSVKFRILKCRNKLKESDDYSSAYINEDLTILRSKLLFHARRLLKKKKINNLWTTNGKICLTDKTGKFHDVSTITRFVQLAGKVDPSYALPSEFIL